MVLMVLKVAQMSEELAVVTKGGDPAMKEKRVAQPEVYQLHGVRQRASGSTTRGAIYRTDHGATCAWQPGECDNHTDDKARTPRSTMSTKWASTIGSSAVVRGTRRRDTP